MSPLNVAIIQAELAWHDAAANRAAFSERIENLEAACDLAILPEMFTTGFTMDAAGQAEKMDGPSVQWLADTAKAASIAICGSLVIEDGGRYFNRFVLMHPDGRSECYDKRHLFRLAGEGEHYSAGDYLPTFDVKGWKLRPMVCYDLRFPVWSRRTEDHDFDLLVYVANWPSPRHHAWTTLLRARAIENQCYVAGVNRCGEDGNEVPYSGGSAIVDYLGRDLANLGDNAGTDMKVLDHADMLAFRQKYPFAVDADAFVLRESALGRS